MLITTHHPVGDCASMIYLPWFSPSFVYCYYHFVFLLFFLFGLYRVYGGHIYGYGNFFLRAFCKYSSPHIHHSTIDASTFFKAAMHLPLSLPGLFLCKPPHLGSKLGISVVDQLRTFKAESRVCIVCTYIQDRASFSVQVPTAPLFLLHPNPLPHPHCSPASSFEPHHLAQKTHSRLCVLMMHWHRNRLEGK